MNLIYELFSGLLLAFSLLAFTFLREVLRQPKDAEDKL